MDMASSDQALRSRAEHIPVFRDGAHGAVGRELHLLSKCRPEYVSFHLKLNSAGHCGEDVEWNKYVRSLYSMYLRRLMKFVSCRLGMGAENQLLHHVFLKRRLEYLWRHCRPNHNA